MPGMLRSVTKMSMFAFRKALERVHAARRRHHFATEVLQHRGNFQDERIVVDNQYGTRHFELPADYVPAAIPAGHRTRSVPLARPAERSPGRTS